MTLFRPILFNPRLLAERNDWEDYFNRQRGIVQDYSLQIAQQEAALNRAVYALFKLTPDEIALIEMGDN